VREKNTNEVVIILRFIERESELVKFAITDDENISNEIIKIFTGGIKMIMIRRHDTRMRSTKGLVDCKRWVVLLWSFMNQGCNLGTDLL